MHRKDRNMDGLERFKELMLLVFGILFGSMMFLIFALIIVKIFF